MTTDRVYTKSHPAAPAGFFPTEAAGLQWLADAGGAPVVDVISVDEHRLVLRRLEHGRPDSESAHRFGRQLASTHRAGAQRFGALPPGAAGYWFGPLDQPIELAELESETFGEFYAEARLRPLRQMSLNAAAIGPDLAAEVDLLCEALREGHWDTYPDGSRVRPARVHGDLWAGNLLWTPEGGTLIDPAAHGGHPETDVAMLYLFGAPHLEEIIAGYARVAGLAQGWQERIALHQVFPLLVHALLFGGGYAQAARSAVQSALRGS